MPTIHVARDGAKLGEFTLEQVRQGLGTGQFRPTDLGWQSGMGEWRPLSEFVGATSAPPPPSNALAVAGVTATASGLPWEHREQLGFFKAFFDTVSLLLTKPAEAFAMMRPEGGITDPMLFALIGGSAGMIVSLLFHVLMQSFTAFGGGSRSIIGMFGMGWVVGYIVMMPVLLALGIFIGSGILHVCLMIVGGANRPFETTLRVVCFSCGAAYLFSMIPICGGLITAVYNIVLECIGLSRAHPTTTGKAVMAVFLPLVVCCGIFLLFGILIGGFGASLTDYFNRH